MRRDDGIVRPSFRLHGREPWGNRNAKESTMVYYLAWPHGILECRNGVYFDGSGHTYIPYKFNCWTYSFSIQRIYICNIRRCARVCEFLTIRITTLHVR